MIRFDEIKLKNVVVYKNLNFKFEKGINVVRGNNKSGKSLIFTPISNVIYSSSPLTKKTNNARKFLQLNSEVCFAWHYNNIKCEAKQSLKGRNLHYAFIKDNKNKKIHKVADNKIEIARNFPLSPDQFYQFTYLNASRPSILITGTESERRQFFERLFEFSIYNKIYAKLSEKASNLRGKQETFRYVTKQIADIRKQLEDLPIKIVEDYVEAKRSYTEHLSAYTKRQELYTTLHTYVSLLKSKKTEYSQIELNKKVRLIKKKINELQSSYQNLVKADEAYANYIEISKKKKALQEKIKSVTYVEPDKINEKINAIKIKIKAMEAASYEREGYINEINRYNKLKPKFSENRTKYEDALKLESKVVTQIERIKSDLLGIKELQGKSTCPTCHQPLSKSLLKKMNNELNQSLETLRKKRDKAKILSDWCYVRDIVKKLPHYNVEEYEALLDEKIALIKKLEKAKIIQAIKQKIESFPKLKKIEKPTGDKKQLELEIKKLNDRLNKYEFDLNIEDQLQHYNLTYKGERAIKKYNELKGKISEYSKAIEKERNKTTNLKILVYKRRDLLKQLKKLKAEFNTLKGSLDKLEIYEALMEAYGARGLRLWQLKTLVQGYEKNLNRFAGLIFNEPIQFRVEASNIGFKIWATRNNVTSEVDLLSGSETRCFQLLSLISLLPYLPAHYRTDTLILDEMESLLDTRSKSLLVTKFLPEIKKLIPKIVLITPLNEKEFSVPDATREFRVIKKGGVSQITKIK